MKIMSLNAPSYVQFGNAKAETAQKVIKEGANLTAADLKELRYGLLGRDQVHTLQAQMHNLLNPERVHGEKPVSIGLDGIRGRAKGVFEGPSIKPIRQQLPVEEQTAPLLAPFDA